MSLLDSIKKQYQRISRSTRLRENFPLLKKLVVGAVVILIGWQLWQIGWTEVLRSLPTHPLFYILFLVMYLTLPIAELLIYRGVWKLPRLPMLRAFITKRVYNEEVVGYSGEVYLSVWATQQTGKPAAEIARDVRDANILSAVNSYFMMLILLGLLLTYEVIPASVILPETSGPIWAGIGLITLTAVFLGIRFRHYYFRLPLHQAVRIISVYASRFAIHHFLLILQWSVVIPGTDLSVWLAYLALIIVINRLPFVPSKDLVFLWAGIGMSQFLDVSSAGIAALLLVSSALNKLLNTGLYLFFEAQKSGKNKREEQN